MTLQTHPPLLVARCRALKAARLDLAPGGRLSVCLPDHLTPPRAVPRNWLDWVRDRPHPFLAALVANHRPLGLVVERLRAVHDNLPADDGFRGYFATMILRESWVVGDVSQGDLWSGSSVQDDEPPDQWREWHLDVTAPPLAAFDELVALARDADAETTRRRDELDALFEPLPVAFSANVPTPTEAAILVALNLRAMKTRQLEHATRIEHSQLMRAVKKLKAIGRIVHVKNLGYYRPDALPPSELARHHGATTAPPARH